MTRIVLDGPVTVATRRNLIAGIRGNPLPELVTDAIIAQAAAFVQKIADAYECDVARGEVSADGSGRASESEPIGHRCPTALLYGRVQSGKTASMITSTALALDNGFRTIVVLTANNVALVRQTANRFKALGGPRVLSTAVEADEYEWEGQIDELREDLGQRGLVLVCAKEATHLPAVIRLLQQLSAAEYPALILDDEADAATPDTTLAARTSARPNAPQFPSATFRRVVENTVPGQLGDSIREILPHHVFAQVTATPFVLLLQRPDSPLFPGVIHLLESGAGYRGGEDFFAQFDADSARPKPPLVLVPDSESQSLLAARLDAPTGLAASINFFILSAAAHALTVRQGRFGDQGYKYLAHTSVRMTQHDHVVDVINAHVHSIRRVLRDPSSDEARAMFLAAYEELQRTAPLLEGMLSALPSLDDLLRIAVDGLSQVEVIKVNASTGEPQYGPAYNFVVGGNILGRGITIDDLLVTYYLRQAQTSQMDTVWQHGRMFGYRAQIMPDTRVFLPRRLAILFKKIHEAEESLRDVLRALAAGQPVPINILGGARATRPNALEPNAIEVYRPGTQIFPAYVVSDRWRHKCPDA
jgi:hypothetical protein